MLERVDVPYADRLAVESDTAFADPDKGGFCTWPELTEMAWSGHVTIAAHGFTHRRLDQPNINLGLEVDGPKVVLASRLGQPVHNFVFPFGRLLGAGPASGRGKLSSCPADRRRHQPRKARPLIYRVDADEMVGPTALFSPGRLAGYHARYLWNRLRLR